MSTQRDDYDRSSGYNMRGAHGRVIDAIGRAIVGGRYEPGSLLPKEAELMEEYGVSRTSLREATKVLAAKGLIEIRQKVGTRVRPEGLWNAFDSDVLTWSSEEGKGEAIIRDLVELREILEPSAARLAAARASKADLERIAKAHLSMAENVRDPARYAESDVEFHMAVFAASHNVLLQRFGYFVADFLHLSFDLQQKALLEREQVLDFSKDVERHRLVYESVNRAAQGTAGEAMLEVILDGKRNLSYAVELDSKQNVSEKSY
ncbi:FadR/GntR family transcriptional regulator [Cryobacterium tagatosivorans]|nr:FadR/GntR family transcriptional regulator [Cryobacterium tagatosivorans]